MSERRLRLKRKRPDVEVLQSYLDKKVMQAMNPLIVSIYQIEQTLQSIRYALNHLNPVLEDLIKDSSYDHMNSLSNVKMYLDSIRFASDIDIGEMEKTVISALGSPEWLDQLAKDVDNYDLGDLLDEDLE